MSALPRSPARPSVGCMAGTVDVSQLHGLLPLGPLRNKRSVDISSADHVDPGGFVCQVAKAGTLTCRAIAGEAD